MLDQSVALLVAQLRAAVEQFGAQDPHLLPAGGLVNGLEELHTLESQIRALQADWLGVAIERDATVDICGRSSRSFLIEEQLLNPAEATRRLRLAYQLPSFPDVRAALRAGDITPAHASLIIDTLRRVPEQLQEIVLKALLEMSRFEPPYLVSRAVDDILAACGVEKDPKDADADRYVSVDETFGGTGSLAGTLTAELTDKIRRALAHAEPAPGPEDDRSSGQRRHDALESIVDHYLDTADLPTDHGERPARVLVTVPLEVLERRLRDQWGVLGLGAPISPENARRLACDAEVIPVVLGGKGEPLDVGQASRGFTAAIRRAAWVRDEGRCVFPRCQRPACRAHHMKHWADGGPSSLVNCAWLCAFHHWLVHEGGWTTQRNPDGSYTFTSRNGREVTGDPPRRRPWVV